MQLSEASILNSSFSPNSNLVAPSRLTQAVFLLSYGFLRVITVPIGIIKGLKLNE